jgi:hypothetical protein
LSKYKDDWWKNAVWAVRNYPARKAEYEELHSQSLSQNITGMPGSAAVSRTTEDIATRQMAPMKQSEYDAVTRAIGITKLLPDGDKRLELIERTYWQGRKLKITQVVYQIGVSEATAWRWHSRFIRQVGECLGYIS